MRKELYTHNCLANYAFLGKNLQYDRFRIKILKNTINQWKLSELYINILYTHTYIYIYIYIYIFIYLLKEGKQDKGI